MRIARLLMFTTVAAATILPASAWTETRVEPFALQQVRILANCAAAQSPAKAAAVLAMDFRSPAYKKAMTNFATAHKRCLPSGKLKFAGVLLAGPLAEALMKRDRATLADRLVASRAVAIEPRSDTERVALCVVDREPAQVAAILGTEAESRAEVEALNPIGESLQICVAPAKEMVFNRPQLRSLLALAAYRKLTDGEVSVAPAAGNR